MSARSCRMMSCILVFYLAVSSGGWRGPVVDTHSATRWPVCNASTSLRSSRSSRDKINTETRSHGVFPHFGNLCLRDAVLMARSVLSVPSVGPFVQDSPNPDALYAKRDEIANAQQAARIWQSRLQQNPKDFESAWKLAKATYWIGTQGPEAERRATLEQGITAGRAATKIEPNRPEGHRWLAANMGALAHSSGLRQALK